MKNILLLENDDSVISTILQVLNSEEFYIHVAENASKGYALALKYLPNLVICNMNLFDSEEDAFISYLRTNSLISNVPIIFLVDNSTNKIQKRKEDYGLDFYIKKPFTANEILIITELSLKKHETLLKETEKKLNNLRGSISFSLPHEFFTPINGIIGFSEILMREYEHLNKSEIFEMLNYIVKDASRLKKLSENFIAFIQLEMIVNDPQKVNSLRESYFVNPKDIIESTAKQCAAEFNRVDDLALELEDAVFRMSEGYLKKLSSEIIYNAFKFSEKGSSVVVSILSNDTSTMFSITDNGKGMTQEQISSIGAFMQFNRKIHDQQGSGLGLIIAKRITELHGGELNIISSLDEGTKVNIIFENQ